MEYEVVRLTHTREMEIVTRNSKSNECIGRLFFILSVRVHLDAGNRTMMGQSNVTL